MPDPRGQVMRIGNEAEHRRQRQDVVRARGWTTVLQPRPKWLVRGSQARRAPCNRNRRAEARAGDRTGKDARRSGTSRGRVMRKAAPVFALRNGTPTTI